MRRLVFSLIAAAALATAAPARAHGPEIAPAPAAAELAGDGWERAFSGRNDGLEGTCVRLAPGVYQPIGNELLTAACDLPPGARLFIQFGAYCGSFGGVFLPSRQRQCAIDEDAAITRMNLSAGDRTVRIDKPRFEFVTRWRWVWVPTGENRGLQTFTAHGYAAMIDNLRVRDKVTLAITLSGESFTFTVKVI